jgi:hypothetical protein
VRFAPRLVPLLFLAVIAAGQTLASVRAPTATPTTPAEWRWHDVLIEFQSLPRTYSCDDLWYKVRDVLLLLGARAYMTLTPYDCGTPHNGEARSPRVEAKFQMPEPLQGSAVRYADTTVSEEAVRLAPGSPHSLQPADCELMRQLQETLLAGLPLLRVTGADFSCTAAAKSFALTVDAPRAAHGSASPRN